MKGKNDARREPGRRKKEEMRGKRGEKKWWKRGIRTRTHSSVSRHGMVPAAAATAPAPPSPILFLRRLPG
jgi:hypothetical protein